VTTGPVEVAGEPGEPTAREQDRAVGRAAVGLQPGQRLRGGVEVAVDAGRLRQPGEQDPSRVLVVVGRHEVDPRLPQVSRGPARAAGATSWDDRPLTGPHRTARDAVGRGVTAVTAAVAFSSP
jgi:hypothetical protein